MAESDIPNFSEGVSPEPAPEPVPLAPVARQERIATMDVLRGLAVFGIFLINMQLYVGPAAAFFDWESNVLWTSEINRLTTLLIYIFAQGKFYTLFSFLFGLGFGVQMLRAEERGAVNFDSAYRRRLLVLLGIGLLHFTLVWWGDVLHAYALLGFLLFLFRERTDKTLLIWVACLTLVPLTTAIGVTSYQHYSAKETPEQKEKQKAEKRQEQQKELVNDMRTMSKGTISEIVAWRLQKDWRQLRTEIGWAVELFTNFLLGLLVARRRILQDPEPYKRILRWLAFLGLPLGLGIACGDLIWGYRHPGEDWPLWRTHTNLIREFVARPLIAYGYAAVLVLVGVRQWMSPFAAVGRMALTNYLLHSLVFTTIANSYGLAMYGRVPPFRALLWCLGFYALQVPFSMLWLRRFAYGPAEWIWRSLTYGRKQPWLREAS